MVVCLRATQHTLTSAALACSVPACEPEDARQRLRVSGLELRNSFPQQRSPVRSVQVLRLQRRLDGAQSGGDSDSIRRAYMALVQHVAALQQEAQVLLFTAVGPSSTHGGCMHCTGSRVQMISPDWKVNFVQVDTRLCRAHSCFSAQLTDEISVRACVNLVSVDLCQGFCHQNRCSDMAFGEELEVAKAGLSI